MPDAKENIPCKFAVVDEARAQERAIGEHQAKLEQMLAELGR